MSERAAFVSAILDNPADDTVRLVFADWLEEHGEPERAEFIRCQIEAANLPALQRAKSKPHKRAKALLRKYDQAWRTALGLPSAEGESEGKYERGFLAGDTIAIHKFEKLAASVLALEPAQFTLELCWSLDDYVSTSIPLKWVEGFAKNPLLRAVTKITSQTGYFGAERFARLMKSPYLINLRVIEISNDTLGVEGVRAIADAPAVFKLISLDLDGALPLGSRGETKSAVDAVKLLATASPFASLNYLGLNNNGLGRKSISALLTSTTLAKTLQLELEFNDVDGDYGPSLSYRFDHKFRIIYDEDGNEVDPADLDRWR